MNFDEFDKKMRVYEQSIDQTIVPGMYIVARLDGRTFTRLTREICKFEAPFDTKFRDMMVATVKELMTDSGFRFIYGYTESDEISLLFDPRDNTFGHKVRKLNSTLAGEASAIFSLQLGMKATFDCRIAPLPNAKTVVDYFSWRQEDSHRNSLNSWCYWTLRKEGMTDHDATQYLSGQSVAFKNEMLFQRDINYNDLPSWQKRGIGIYFMTYEKAGFNPITNEEVLAKRRRLETAMELPIGSEYRTFIASRMLQSKFME
jgi:tRNA(His)-5''-guanylyltransferase (EC 2.7.7.-)